MAMTGRRRVQRYHWNREGKLVPLFEKVFRKHKRSVGKSSRMDETYIKVRGQWKYLYRAVDKAGETVDFLPRARRDNAVARRYFEKAMNQNGAPETVTMDKSGSQSGCHPEHQR